MAIASRSTAALTRCEAVPGSASGHAGLLLAAMYVLSVVGFPLVSTVPVLLGLDSQAATVPYRAAMAGLSFAILYGWWLQRTRVLFTLPVVLALSLWVLLMGRLLLDTVIEPLPGEIGMPLSQFLLLSLGACFLPSLAFLQAPSVMTSDLARRMIEMLGAVALLLLLYLGLQGVFAGGVLRRLSTPVLNPISVGHLAVSVLIVAMCGLAGAGLSARVLRWLLMAVSMVVIVASASRGPILATLLVVLVFAFGRKRPGRYGPLRVAGYVVLITGLVVGVMLAVDWLEQNDYVRLAERLSDTMADASAQERLAMATGAWRQFLDKPVLGSYALELRSYTYPHNVLLESLMATGIVGFALLLGSMGPATLAALRIIRAESPYMWIALIYLQYVVHCMVSGSLYLEASFWSFAFGSLAVAQAIPRAGNARRQ